MNKYEMISHLASEIQTEITEDEKQWKGFLSLASRLYRYPFEDQLLIYAQRPDATACASMEIWNEKMFCWVNRGAKGIALIDRDSNRKRLRYVFDVSDVHKARRIGKTVYLWQFREEHAEAVITHLEKIYGKTTDSLGFEHRLMEMAEHITEDYLEDVMEEVMYVSEGSFLEELEEVNLRLRVRETVSDSLSYMLLTRCGIQAEDWMDENAFSYIYEMNTGKVVSVIGSATTELATPMLIEIGKVIAHYDRQIRRNKSKNKTQGEYFDTYDKKMKKGLANEPEGVYNSLTTQTPVRVLKGEDFEIFKDFNTKDWYVYDSVTNKTVCYLDSEKEAEEHIIWMVEHNKFYKEERKGEKDEPDISEKRRLSDSQSDFRQGTRGEDDEVRTSSGKILEGTSPGSLQRTFTGGDLERTLLKNSASGRGTNGVHEQAVSTERGSERKTQSEQSNELGSEDEQYLSESGGSHSKGTDLPLVEDSEKEPETEEKKTDVSGSFSLEKSLVESPQGEFQQMDLFATFGEQIGNVALAIAEEPKKHQPEKTLPSEWIEEILRTGGGRLDSRKRIYAKFQQGKSPDEMEAFLSAEYGTTGKGFVFEENKVSMWSDKEGIHISYGTTARENADTSLSWSAAESVIRAMVEQGNYMTEQEAFLVHPIERKRIANDLYFFFRDGMEEYPEGLGLTSTFYQEATEQLVEMMESQSGLQQLQKVLKEIEGELERGEKTLRFRITPIEKLIAEVQDLMQELKVFPMVKELEIRNEDFITQDEIDYDLTRGSGFVEGNFRIYDYVKEGHTEKEVADYLKHEYGTGGRSHALPGNDRGHEDHDAKGIRLAKGNILNPDATVLLSWKTVAKRVMKLVKEERYFSEDGQRKYEDYQYEKAQKILQGAQARLDKERTPEVEEELEKIEEIEEKTVSPAENYRITDDNLGLGTLREKFAYNMEAIETLQQIESENRPATLEEQNILAKYVGWGGLADAFDESKQEWSKENEKLKKVLSKEEYEAARGSTLNAYYTSPVIIRGIYSALEKMGFEKGNILEPSMGIGNFFGSLPETMKKSKLYGVELDDITGRIAKKLYPDADIRIGGFEETVHPDDFFDVAIGNVPFGQYKVADRKYDKHNLRGTGFLIHDYFFAKSLDKIRPGGVVAFITSKGTMDKKNPSVRRYLAQRAELIGAIRLPNTAFKANAGTEVTSDIIFLKKRDRIVDEEPDWVHLGEDENGIAMNSYFVQHPEMILGHMEMISGPYGMESACLPKEDISFDEQLKDAIGYLDGEIDTYELDELADEFVLETIPASPDVKNYSYTLVDGNVYYRENSIMRPEDVSESMQERIKGMVQIRDCTREVIDLQLEEFPDSAIKEKQKELNELYDSFSKKFGIINSRTNRRAFQQDNSYCLLCSLEKLDEEGNFLSKADMFTKRTIQKAQVVTSVDTASEALAVSLSEKAKIDLPYMVELSGKTEEMLIEELTGVIFENPLTKEYETADEYLSGNVRDKLHMAETVVESHPEYQINVEALKRIQPKDLDASEIEVRLGATWVETKYINDFMKDTFQTPEHLLNRDVIKTQYSDITGQWNIKGKNADYGNSLATGTYGSNRRNAYQILEDSLNLKDSRVYDVIVEDGKEKRIINKKETTIASQKQEMVREAFKDWVFRDQERREVLVKKYNELFNATRPREYDGSHLTFPGMTPDIELKDYQKNAVAHVLYGGNTLLAHCVGAGKTFEMTAAAMESKRLGLCQKSMFVVPNHLTEQWASDFLRLYPGANILAATKKDFQPANRKKFCSRIATGDYDAVIIGHSQFEKVPLSSERQIAIIERQIDEITIAIAQAKEDNGERYTIKQMEKSRKTLQVRLEKLNDNTRKDDVVTFEQLGVDRLFVDESHNYKNLFLYTKMRNVAGIAQSEAQKSSDMFAKCQYLDELTGGKGITFATGTPISNSMTELYTNMRYLQYDTLQRMGLGSFDSWAATFGETITAIELAPEGTGYRAKTRFARFFNLPELIALFKESADIQTPDMLNLPIPEAEYENVVLQPSDYQKDMVKSLAERAEAVRDRRVEPYEDNMLKITNDGRKLALDQRLINDMLPDEDNSKAATCVDNC